MKFVSEKVEDTYAAASVLAEKLTGGEVILLEGRLGAGKTTFTKGLAAALGVKERVTSPTFTIMNEYDGGRLKLYHLDMYRIGGEDEVYELGLEEFLFGSGVTVIEWNKFVNLPERIYRVKIDCVSDSAREIEIL